ncbi:nucleoside hydrolase [Sphaerochaeta sp. PS]|uniref:nucleoside hydrolase n=1 Tax=Sphaerochaeta sp. PS TaxID=3076336 RepID=UPI0028A3D46C|nr:nucleoside hydrolase [Sphaerochaeta sp. PS]MDT4763279.1 nucleoside hydrolase [Sphaerochaeta sp. PS]
MQRIILDVDTGLDDAVAIILAAGSPSIHIEGLVATSGNVGLERTLENTLNVCEVVGIEAPVYRGSSQPLVRDKVDAGDFHGESGLDGPVFQPRRRQQVQEGSGIQFIIDTIMANPHEITLVPVGPLTDIAVAMQREPRIISRVKEIVLMGGSFVGGNVTKEAEFNTYADPEAAQIVFTSGAPLVMFPLDCTTKVTLSPEQLERYHTFTGESARLFCSCMDSYMANYQRKGKGHPAMHDPLCIAYLIDPKPFLFERHEVSVELEDAPTYGKTLKGKETETGGVLVAKKGDTTHFWSLIDQALLSLR